MTTDNLLKVKRVFDCKPAVKSISGSAVSILDLSRIKLSLGDYIPANDFDIVALTEAWLGSTIDTCIGELLSTDYVMKHIPCRGRKGGGGLTLIYKYDI